MVKSKVRKTPTLDAVRGVKSHIGELLSQIKQGQKWKKKYQKLKKKVAKLDTKPIRHSEIPKYSHRIRPHLKHCLGHHYRNHLLSYYGYHHKRAVF